MSPKKDDYMRGYSDGFKDGMAQSGETGMVPVTGKERPMLRPEAASTEARFESASLHQIEDQAQAWINTFSEMNWRETIEKAFSEPVEHWPTGWRESYPALSEPDLTEVKRRLLASPPQEVAELAAAQHEASCCDDIPLNQSLAGIISDLQADRQSLWRKAEVIRKAEVAEATGGLIERLNNSAAAADKHAVSGSNVSFAEPKSAWAYDAALFCQAATALTSQSAELLSLRRKVEEMEALSAALAKATA